MLFSIANTNEYIIIGMETSISIIDLKKRVCVKMQEDVFENNEYCYCICVKKINEVVYLFIGTTEKRILILKMKEDHKIEVFKIHKLPKTISSMYISNCDELYITDKFGDCHRVSMVDGSIEYTIIGHISMLLSVVADDKYIVTGDRDETIKVTDRVHSYVVISYLMGHENYVSALRLVNGRWLISGGGDSYVSIWDNVANSKQTPIKIQLSTEQMKVADITSDGLCVLVTILGDPRLNVIKLDEHGSKHCYKQIEIPKATGILKTMVTDTHIIIIYHIDGRVHANLLDKGLEFYENKEVTDLILKGINLVITNKNVTGDMMIDHPKQKKDVTQKSKYHS